MENVGKDPGWQWSPTHKDYIFIDSANNLRLTRDQYHERIAPRHIESQGAYNTAPGDVVNQPSSPNYVAYRAPSDRGQEALRQASNQAPSASFTRFTRQFSQFSVGSSKGNIQESTDRNGIHSKVQTGPAEQITDPELLKARISAHKKILAADEKSQLYPCDSSL